MRSQVGGRKSYRTTPPTRPCQVRSSSGLDSSVATAATTSPTTATRIRRRSPRKVRILRIEEYSNDNLSRLETVLAGGVDGHKAPNHYALAEMAHSWSRDQAVALAVDAGRARPGAWTCVHPQGVLRDRHSARPVLLHHSAVPASLAARDHLRQPWGRPPHLQLRQADAVGARAVSSRQLDRQHRRRDPRLPLEGTRATHRRDRWGYRSQLPASRPQDLHLKPFGDRHRRR